MIGEPSNLYHQEIKAFVVPEDPQNPPTSEVIFQFCQQYLAEYKIPKNFVFVDDIPKGATGKILRKAFRSE